MFPCDGNCNDGEPRHQQGRSGIESPEAKDWYALQKQSWHEKQDQGEHNRRALFDQRRWVCPQPRAKLGQSRDAEDEPRRDNAAEPCHHLS
jgi:hypothetical protein